MFADTLRTSPAVAALKPILRPLRDAARTAKARARSLATPARLAAYDKLHLGSGLRHMEGWANLDLQGDDNLIWDLRKPLPVAAGAIRYVYSEHFIEHVTRDDALKLMRNCRAVLAPGGVARLSTPDLQRLADDYRAGDIPKMAHADWRPTSLCRMVNEAMRLWGHQFLYDEDEMRAMLTEAGFSKVRRMPWRESEHPELRGLETRPYFGDLIVEAVA
jgi:predicted SAM-dependent methyltransferase